MAEIVLFVPKREVDASANLKAFVRLCRQELTQFGAGLEWDRNDWDITDFVDVRGRKGRIALVFSNYDTAGRRKGTFTPMAPEFCDFAKAYMRYQNSVRPAQNNSKRMAVLRALEKILTDRSPDGIPHIEYTNAEILNATALLIKRDSGDSYRQGNDLQILARFLVKHRLTTSTFSWKNPFKRPNYTDIRVGPEADKRRSERLPSAEAIDALIEAYRMATEPYDVIITSIAALLVCAPDRINEVFRLPILCEHWGNYQGQHAYGLRWWPAKEAAPQIKWIIGTMADIAHEAVQRLMKHTEVAREMARWYEKNPRKLYLPKEYEYLRNGEYVASTDLQELLGFACPNNVCRWLETQGVQPTFKAHRRNWYCFKEVEKAIIDLLPRHFPIYDKRTHLRYSDLLILLPKRLTSRRAGIFKCMFEPISTDQFNNGLDSGGKHGFSVFTRLGLKDPTGKPVKITSHQFRHWLNTLAQNAGLSQLHIAKWSGRKDIRQNASYDHLTGDQLVARARELSGGRLFGPIADFVVNAPMSKEEFLKLAFPTAHVTEYGYCIHDWTMSPCLKYRDCLLCMDHLCVKGNWGSERLMQRLVMEEELLERARIAFGEGYFGADRWLEHHQMNVEILHGHKEILNNPDIPDGSVYQLSGIREHSPVTQAIEQRMELDDPDAVVLKQVMERLSALQQKIGKGPEALAYSEEDKSPWPPEKRESQEK